jgi:hypothetical protein
MSSSDGKGSNAPVRKGKRVLEEEEGEQGHQEPAAKRKLGLEKVKPLEEGEEVEPVVVRKRGRPKKVASVAMDVDEDHAKAVASGLASSSTGKTVGAVETGGAKARIAKRSSKKTGKGLQQAALPEHWIFDEGNVPHDVLVWVLDWFTRQESCLLRVVCRKWSGLVGLRVFRQTPELTEGNAFLRIPASQLLGIQECPWVKSPLASQITAINLATNEALGQIFNYPSPTMYQVPSLLPFKGLHHLAVSGTPRILSLIHAANLKLESLTLFAINTASRLPDVTAKTRFPETTRVQIASYNSITLTALTEFFKHFPAVRYISLHKVGLEAPKSTAEWIATQYAAVLESLQLDLVPYAETPKEEYLSLCQLGVLMNMPHLRVLNIFGNDIHRPGPQVRSTVRDEKNAVTYRSNSLECLSIESPNGIRTPITLEMPHLAELSATNILYLDAAECPGIENLSIDGPFEFTNQFFKKHPGSMLQKLKLACQNRPLQASHETKLNLSLPLVTQFDCNLGHDQIASLAINAPKLSVLWLVMHHTTTEGTIQAPNLEELYLNASGALLNKMDQQLKSWPLLRKKVFVDHDLQDPHIIAPPAYRPDDSALALLPPDHPTLSSVSITSNHRTLASYIGYRQMTRLTLRSMIYEDDLRSILSSGTELPNLMELNVYSSGPPRLDNETNAVMTVNLPSITFLELELHRIPQLKFSKNKYLTTLKLKLEKGTKSTMIQKLEWIKQLPALEALCLEQLKLPTTFSISSPTLRVLQLIKTNSHQAPNITLDCPKVRVLVFQYASNKIKTLIAKLSSLEKLIVSDNHRSWADTLWGQDRTSTERQNIQYTPATLIEHWQRPNRAIIVPRYNLYDRLLTPEMLLPLLLFQQRMGAFHGGHVYDSDSDDDDDDSDDEDRGGDVCPNCGRVHGRASPSDSDEEEDVDDYRRFGEYGYSDDEDSDEIGFDF